MDQFAELTGRHYELFEYHGAPDAERVIVLMGSGCEAAHETVDFLSAQRREGRRAEGATLSAVRRRALCRSACRRRSRAIAVLDRTKEPGAAGEPLYLDCVNALYEAWPRRDRAEVVGGRYGLSSKEFTPAMVKAVFDNLAQPAPKNHFTDRHRRRCFADQPDYRSRRSRSNRMTSFRAHVLRARIGRHGRRQQGIDQNHRRKHRPLRAGIFRLRFEESGRDDHFASALRAAADSLDLPHHESEFCCLSSAISSRDAATFCGTSPRAGRSC